MPRPRSSEEIFSVVRRVQRTPVMGSPATSCFINSSMAAITSGVFFRGRPPPTGSSHSLALDVLSEKLRSSSGHGARVEAQEFGDTSVPTVAELHRLEPIPA